ncbi:MAG: glycosyltransferase family 1 protein [Alphaproteobacteria bacterium]|nr:glycosyltransferase family 1 protein [Alphaproteobacteria bacterium]
MVTLLPEKIYINGRFLTQPLSGVQRFAEEVVKGLDRALARDPGCLPFEQITLIVPKGARRLVELENIAVIEAGLLSGHFWDQLDLARLAHDGFLLSLCNSGPILHGRQILAVHDAAVFANPENFSSSYRILHRTLEPLLARQSVALITVSKFSRRELSHYCGVPEEKFHIVQNGADHILSQEPDNSVIHKNKLQESRFLLAVGNISRNKNVNLIIQAFRRMRRDDLSLVVVGGEGRPFAQSIPDVDNEIVSAGYVTDQELRALYENALGFVFPSLYEGFGIPPLEAMLCGCPVIVSRAAALPETCADAALYCDPSDPGSLADRIQELADQPGLRDNLRSRGRQHANRFTWERATSQLINVMKQVVRPPIPLYERSRIRLR